MAGPAVLMAAATRLVPADKRGLATGIVNAGGSTGQFLLAPIAAALIVGVGWVGRHAGAGGCWCWWACPRPACCKGNARQTAPAGHKPVGAGAAIREALGHRGFLLLAAGFFVCGFHVAFLATHLPGVVAACGLAHAVGRLGARAAGPVQHRRQHRHRLGRRAAGA